MLESVNVVIINRRDEQGLGPIDALCSDGHVRSIFEIGMLKIKV